MQHYRRMLLLPLAALALAACDGGSSTGSDTPRLTIRVHDAPGDIEEAWVKIDEIYLQGSSDADSTSGRVVLSGEGTGEWIDLLTLDDDFATLISGEPVPAGSYSQLRFVVCEAYIVTADSGVYATSGADLPAGLDADGQLQLPSACQSGFKVKLPGDSLSLEGDLTTVDVDFDVSQSFHRAGNSGRWIMRPVLHATVTGGGGTGTGTISGTVSLASGVTLPASCGADSANLLTRFVPTATASGDSLGLSGTVNTSGQYSISAAPGTYAMGYDADVVYSNGDSLTFTATATPPSVTVAANTTSTSNYSITAATCH
jgi:uncharacterized protein DUF4382